MSEPTVGDKRIRVRQNVDGTWDWKVDTFSELRFWGQSDMDLNEDPEPGLFWRETEWGYEAPSRQDAVAAARWHADPPEWETAEAS